MKNKLINALFVSILVFGIVISITLQNIRIINLEKEMSRRDEKILELISKVDSQKKEIADYEKRCENFVSNYYKFINEGLYE